MSVRETSLEAYRALENSGTLQRREREVILAVHRHFPFPLSFTRKELARAMGWEINRVTGRVLTLIEKRYLTELTERKDGGYLVRVQQSQLTLL